jgi:hypothetical protein
MRVTSITVDCGCLVRACRRSGERPAGDTAATGRDSVAAVGRCPERPRMSPAAPGGASCINP